MTCCMDRKNLAMCMTFLLFIVPVAAIPSLESVPGSDMLSAEEQKNISEAQQHQKTSPLTDPKFLTPMSEEDFLKYNQPAIEKMAEKVGKSTALENARGEYKRSVGSGMGNVTPKAAPYWVVFNIWGNDMWLYPWETTSQNVADPNNGPIGFIIEKERSAGFLAHMLTRGWYQGSGWTEYGISGPSTSQLKWDNSFGLYQLERPANSYFTVRTHCAVLDAGYAPNFNDNWIYGQAHLEYWTGSNHVIMDDGYTAGRNLVRDTVGSKYSLAGSINLDNYSPGVFRAGLTHVYVRVS